MSSEQKQEVPGADHTKDHLSNFEGVLKRELETLRPRADLGDGALPAAHRAKLSGLAFSGGGIRSATFNLGVLQGLARMGLLDKFDYLSTVSGGGYIGAWLCAWIRREINDEEELLENKPGSGTSSARNASWAARSLRFFRGLLQKKDIDSSKSAFSDPRASIKGFEKVRAALAEHPQNGRGEQEPSPIAYLRRYSNYLTPRRGLWSTDTWTLIVSYLRNSILTAIILIGVLAAAVLIARAAMTLNVLMLNATSDTSQTIVYGLFLACLAGAAYIAARELRKCQVPAQNSTIQAWITVALTVVSLWLGTAVLWYVPKAFLGRYQLALFTQTILIVLLAGAAGTIVPGFKKSDRENPIMKLRRVPAAIGGAVSLFFAFWGQLLVLDHFAGYGNTANWLTVMWGPLLTLIAFGVFATVFVGLAGVDLGELEREWLSRLLAAVSKWTILFCLFVIALIYTPVILSGFKDELLTWRGGALGALWAIVSFSGAKLAGMSKTTDSKAGQTLRKALISVAPPIFVAGLLLILIACLSSKWMNALLGHQLHAPGNDWLPGITARSMWTCLVAGIAVFVASWLWSWRVGVNTFSLHALYGNRLIRAYLGASNLKRNAHPYTDFDPGDNAVRIADLIPGISGYHGPYLIINAAINLVQTATRRLAWQQRKAGAFIFSPLFCGYQFPHTGNGANKQGRSYVPSRLYADGKDSTGGISLGKAMTISGAAASPNMGYYSSPALAFLMTVFNVRLGWWLPNTGKADPNLWAQKGPSQGLFYLLCELLGKTNDQRRYAYISDGGHFENLGIYELVRRRCRFILCCDAEADAEMQFRGIGMAIERCRTDFGIPIDIDVTQLRRDAATGLSQWHCAAGKIRYSRLQEGLSDGILLYIKASRTGDEPRDIAAYAAEYKDFPHQTTADQWFDAAQFEGYRALGFHIVTKIMKESVEVVQRNVDAMSLEHEEDMTAGGQTEIPPTGKIANAEQEQVDPIKEKIIFMEDLSEEMVQRWYPQKADSERAAGEHDKLLAGLLDTLRNDQRLAFLDCQLYPDLAKHFQTLHHDRSASPWVPNSYDEMRAGFLFCNRLIQFMQQICQEQELDMDYDTPGRRRWVSLFQQWSLSRMVRYTWSMTAGTYGKRFQTFCTHQLKLEVGELSWAQPLDIAILRDGDEIEIRPAPHHVAAYPEQGDDGNAWRRVERAFGLNFFESQLACEYLRNYCSALEKKKKTIPTRFQLFPLQVSTENPTSIKRGGRVSFTAGFAIVQPVEHPSDRQSTLLYLRIRPNMRHLNLARKALAALYRGEERLPSQVSPATIERLVPTEEHWHRRIYLELYPMQQESKSRRRIAEMINREIKAAQQRREAVKV